MLYPKFADTIEIFIECWNALFNLNPLKFCGGKCQIKDEFYISFDSKYPKFADTNEILIEYWNALSP